MIYVCQKCNKKIKVMIKEPKDGLEYTIKCPCGGRMIRHFDVLEEIDNYDDHNSTHTLNYEQKCKKCKNVYPITSNRLIGSDLVLRCSCGNKCFSKIFEKSWISKGFIETPRMSLKSRLKRDKRKEYLETCPESEITLVNDKFPREV